MLAIEPYAGATPVADVIRHARRVVDINVYEITSPGVFRAIDHACANGVRVRLILDTKPYRGRRILRREKRQLSQLPHDCVHWKPAPNRFQGHYRFDHAKYVIADPGTAHAQAALGTANFTWSAFHRNREYIWTTHSRKLTAALADVFKADWHHRRAGSAPRHELVLSPGSAPVLLHVIQQKGPVEIEAEEMGSARRILRAIARKGRRVRIILPHRMGRYERRRVASLRHAGVQVRTISHPYMHAKMIVGSRLAFIGSENFSRSSLYKNREVGILLGSRTDLARLQRQFAKDWSRAH